jgi:CheY-like chemotaxis protein
VENSYSANGETLIAAIFPTAHIDARQKQFTKLGPPQRCGGFFVYPSANKQQKRFAKNLLKEPGVFTALITVTTRSLFVLVIDDDPDVLRAVQLSLRSTGWKITTAVDAREGLKLAGTLRPDVILCDAIMPHLSGPDVIEALRSAPATSATPIVLMTGLVAETFADTPWSAFLAKPFGPVELRAAIENAVAHDTGFRSVTAEQRTDD